MHFITRQHYLILVVLLPKDSTASEWTDPSVFNDLKTLTEKQQQENTRFFKCNLQQASKIL
jgi:hypothetical protein